MLFISNNSRGMHSNICRATASVCCTRASFSFREEEEELGDEETDVGRGREVKSGREVVRGRGGGGGREVEREREGGRGRELGRMRLGGSG